MGPTRAVLDAGRVHFQHGPIDLVIGVVGEGAAAAEATERAWRRFDGLLEQLVEELPLLRGPVQRAGAVTRPVARRMVAACRPYADVFITPMAAVAGAVADEILASIVAVPGVRKAYVNNGGDIALHLVPAEQFRIGMVTVPTQPMRHGHTVALDGRFAIEARMPVRGVATSGWRGRSHSLGIADSVTVLARDAAAADAAATIIANAVDIDHPAVVRRPAAAIDDNTDLGDRLVTVDVGPLPAAVVAAALDRGAARACELLAAGLIFGAALVLGNDRRVTGGMRDALPVRDTQEVTP